MIEIAIVKARSGLSNYTFIPKPYFLSALILMNDSAADWQVGSFCTICCMKYSSSTVETINKHHNTLFPQAAVLFKDPDILESIKDKLFHFPSCCVESSQTGNLLFVSLNKGMRC